jgi:hypothetical protein
MSAAIVADREKNYDETKLSVTGIQHIFKNL